MPSMPWPWTLPFRRTWPRLDFPTTNAPIISPGEIIEEETLPDYVATRYYPVVVGQVLRSQYQIVGKLGFGTTATVWLARDMRNRRYVALKLYIHSHAMGRQLDHELETYKAIERGPRDHPGRHAVRSLLDSFEVDGPDGRHLCLVHTPLWESVLAFLHRNDEMRFPPIIMAPILRRVFIALDYLHTECHLIHTDIKADNIMFSIDDDGVFRDFEETEINDPSPRKEVDGRTIYESRQLGKPRNFGSVVLCDFGSTVRGDQENRADVQPDVYRSPEVILKVPWGYSIDIWNVACMIWDVFEGGHLFYGLDPEHDKYRGRAHLSEMIALMGPPPTDLLARGALSHKFFSPEGDFTAGIPLPEPVQLSERETSFDGEDQAEEKAVFLRFMAKMLQWKAEDRETASQLAEDEWIRRHSRRP